MSTAVAAPPLTAEEFSRRPDPGYPEELVRGEIIPLPIPGALHGLVCGTAAYVLGNFVERSDLGRVLLIHGIITERDPDTVRGPDVSYYSYARLPRGPLADGYGPEVPDLIFDVRSPSERWVDLHKKIGEYLRAGVRAVIVLEPEQRTAHVFTPDAAPLPLGPEEELALPEILGDFRVPAGRFFP